ncbi:hypothetical protein [Actinomadura nitritigenes]|uniref:hypothetical protein n=1 Tax=Actinomadura nitritigenes TaxID=134602 RepID=UPI003D8D4EA8
MSAISRVRSSLGPVNDEVVLVEGLEDVLGGGLVVDGQQGHADAAGWLGPVHRHGCPRRQLPRRRTFVRDRHRPGPVRVAAQAIVGGRDLLHALPMAWIIRIAAAALITMAPFNLYKASRG